MSKFLFGALFIFFFSFNSFAQLIQLQVTDYDGLDSIPFMKNFLDSYAQSLENDVNDNYPQGSIDNIMEAMADSSVIAGKGLGSDYGMRLKVWTVGVGAGIAADTSANGDVNSEISGFGAAPELMVGRNLGDFGAKRVNLYVNLMNYSRRVKMAEQVGINSTANLDVFSTGFRLRYDWIDGHQGRYYDWGGVKLHSGYEYNYGKYTFESDVDQVVDLDSGQGRFNARIQTRPKVEVLSRTHSIPLEISSDIKFGYVSFFGGFGADLNFGKSESSAVADGDVNSIVCTGGLCGGGKLVELQATGNADSTGYVSAFLFRGFLGLQLNLSHVVFFAQFNRVIGQELIGASTGIRLVY